MDSKFVSMNGQDRDKDLEIKKNEDAMQGKADTGIAGDKRRRTIGIPELLSPSQ